MREPCRPQVPRTTGIAYYSGWRPGRRGSNAQPCQHRLAKEGSSSESQTNASFTHTYSTARSSGRPIPHACGRSTSSSSTRVQQSECGILLALHSVCTKATRPQGPTSAVAVILHTVLCTDTWAQIAVVNLHGRIVITVVHVCSYHRQANVRFQAFHVVYTPEAPATSPHAGKAGLASTVMTCRGRLPSKVSVALGQAGGGANVSRAEHQAPQSRALRPRRAAGVRVVVLPSPRDACCGPTEAPMWRSRPAGSAARHAATAANRHARKKEPKTNQKGHHTRARRASDTAPLRTGADRCKTGSAAGKCAGARSNTVM